MARWPKRVKTKKQNPLNCLTYIEMSQGVQQSQLVIPIEMERTQQRQSKSSPSRRRSSMIQYRVYMNAEQLYAVHTEESENKTQDKRNTRKGVEERKNASVTLIVIYINI
jgi:hypothetical protein